MLSKHKLAVGLLSLTAVAAWSAALLMSTSAFFEPAEQQAAQPVVSYSSAPAAWPSEKLSFATRKEGVTSRQGDRLNSLRPQRHEAKVLGAATVASGLEPERISDLAKPGVISLINSIQGSLEIPDFHIDLKSLALLPRRDLPDFVLPVDLSVYGSGFVISPDGYALTNAHVVSASPAYEDLSHEAREHFLTIFENLLDAMSDQEFQAISDFWNQRFGTGEAGDELFEQAIYQAVDDYIAVYATDRLEQSIVAVDKSLLSADLPQDGELAEVIKRGMAVELVGFDHAYEDGGLDVALIKLPVDQAPALALGNSGNASMGARVYLFGYPYNAQIDQADLIQPTMTQGIISARKNYRGREIFQLDNKASQGSSGGPMVDNEGRVIGILTYMSGDPFSGDDFSYAIPIDQVDPLLEINRVAPRAGFYESAMRLGWENQSKQNCQKALQDFERAGQADSRFGAADHVAKYRLACQAMIAAGDSRDGWAAAWGNFYSNQPLSASLFSALLMVLSVLAVFLLVHFARHRHHMRFSPDLPPPPLPAR